MTKFLMSLLILGGIFYIITYPYSFKLGRKLKKVLEFEEVGYLSNPLVKSEKFDIEKELEIEKKTLVSQGYIQEELEYITIKNRKSISEDIPILVLLHGLRDRAEDWIERGKLCENYLTLLKEGRVSKMNFVLLNSGCEGMGWYTNFCDDKNSQYENYIVEEVFPRLKEEFPNSRFGIAGFSMGGYGAFKLALKYPTLFKVVGSFSGATSIVRMSVNRRVIRIFGLLYIPKFIFHDEDKRHFLKVFSSWGYKILREDPYTLIKKAQNEDKNSRFFYLSVGEQDIQPYLMLQQWIDTVGRMKKHGYKFKAHLCKDETHTWDFVAKDLKNFLIYFNDNMK